MLRSVAETAIHQTFFDLSFLGKRTNETLAHFEQVDNLSATLVRPSNPALSVVRDNQTWQ